MTHSDYDSPGTAHRDFRYLAPLVVMTALQAAGTSVCEPIHRFHLEIPSDTVGVVARALARLEAVTHTVEWGRTTLTMEGDIAAVKVHELQRLLPALSRGEGVLESIFDHYRAVRGEPPIRQRTDRDPLNRGEYLRQVLPRY
jgi:ribosomal protection tetracycline resistance protein